MKTFLILTFVILSRIAISQEKKPIPPGEENALTVLNSSPRHGEWVDIPYEGSTVPIRTWVVYPERRGKAPVIILIHEIFGLTDWLRSVTDQCANEGYIAVAPDLISGFGPNGGGTESVGTRDSVVQLIRSLSAEETYKRLNAVVDFAVKIPSGNGKIATVGFCWGGGRSFGYACAQPKLKAAVVYYGTSPDSSELGMLTVPVLGLYGGDDARVVSTVEPASTEIKRLGKSFEVEIYDGAGHGFLRQQSARDGANLKASQQAWKRMLGFLKKHL